MHPAYAFLVPILLASAACQQTESADTSMFPAVASQLEHGARAYTTHCAECHGNAGQGKKGPPLVGPGALPLHPRADQKLRSKPFHTALDVAEFATQSMPPTASARAEVSAEDYWAVLAFALDANGVELTEPLGPSNAGSIVINP